ncbi:MAG: hypothetical protein FWD58_10595 [Firmicutes bacterium]|nr:hypothetical protein [Bacillota bacterium]
MDTNEPKLIDQPSGEGTRIAKIALKTAGWFALVAALFCAVFVSAFPYTSMRLYFNAGLKAKTLESAERVISRARSGDLYYGGQKVAGYNCKFADALYMAVNLSADAMDKSFEKYGESHKKTTSSAKKTLKYADMYLPPLEADGDSGADKFALLRSGRNKVVDNALRAFRPKQDHPAISFENTVWTGYMRAQILAGESGRMTETLENIAANIMGHWEEDMSTDYALLLVVINAAISAELSIIGYDYPSGKLPADTNYLDYIGRKTFALDGRFVSFFAGGEVKPSLSVPVMYAYKFRAFVNGYPAGTPVQALERAQMAHNLFSLSSNILIATEILLKSAPQNDELAALKSEWQALGLGTWYGEILADYMSAVVK